MVLVDEATHKEIYDKIGRTHVWEELMNEEQLAKLQCENLRHRVEEMASVFTDDFEGVVGRLVEEGKRVSRSPWCVDIFCEMEANRRLNGSYKYRLSGYPQETMDETIKRRKGQPDLMIEIYGCIIR